MGEKEHKNWENRQREPGEKGVGNGRKEIKTWEKWGGNWEKRGGK